jgi:phage repressor protein C with HTH and peptisase S24 domain
VKKHASDVEVERLRKALTAFMESRGLVRTTWCKASGVSESSVRWFLSGRTRSLNDATYRKLAANQNVPVAVLRGEEIALTRTLPIRSYVGAGAEVIPFDDDPPIDTVALPDWSDLASEGYVVRGDSMRPMFHDGDVLFPQRYASSPDRHVGGIVLVELKDGRRLVKKLMRGARSGRWTLLSVNPDEPPLQDQQVVRAAGIPFVKRKL